MDYFDDVVNGYSGGHTKRNALIPTSHGYVKPTYRYPIGQRWGLCSLELDMFLVGFQRLPDLDAEYCSAAINSSFNFDCDGVNIEFPAASGNELDSLFIAKSFDRYIQNESRPDDFLKIIHTVEREIDKSNIEPERIGFPAILGLNRNKDVLDEIETRLDKEVFEVSMPPPSIPGIRLEKKLYRELEEKDVSLDLGRKVVDYSGEDRIDSIEYEKTGGGTLSIEADQFILATGGLVGKGIKSTKEDIKEPIFDCSISYPEDRYDWFSDSVLNSHRFASFGVDIDEDMHPINHDGGPEFSNLRAAGSVIGGFDFTDQKSGSGVSISTGYFSGLKAAGEV